MNHEQKQALVQMIKNAWMPIVGGVVGLVIGLFFIWIGFWKTLLLLLLVTLGAVGGYFLRRFVGGTRKQGLFTSDQEDDVFHSFRND